MMEFNFQPPGFTPEIVYVEQLKRHYQEMRGFRHLPLTKSQFPIL